MKHAKKFLAATMALVMAFSAAITASAKTETYKGFGYKVRSNDTVLIWDYSGNSPTIKIPSKIDGKPVVKLADLGCIKSYTTITNEDGEAVEVNNTKKIIIPKTVKSIKTFYNHHFGKYSVDKNNKYFASKDGMLLSKNKKTLYDAPFTYDKASVRTDKRGGKTATYTVPKYIESIADNALAGFDYEQDVKITKLVLPKGLKKIGERAFAEFGYGTFNLTIPNTVTTIGKDAFYSCYTKTVKIPKSVKKIGLYAFGYNYSGSLPRFKDMVIKGYKGTAAEKYAKQNKFKFVALD